MLTNRERLKKFGWVAILIVLVVLMAVIGMRLAEGKLLPARRANAGNESTATPLSSTSPTTANSPTATPRPTQTATPTRTATATATFTPSRTRTPTVTPPPTDTTTPTATLAPTPLPANRPTPVAIGVLPTLPVSATYGIPAAVPRFDIPADAITVVLLGSDQRPDWEHWNTDVIQYVVIYPDVPSVAVLSIPRDLYVYIPGYTLSRINVADMYGERNGFDGGGFGLLNQTLLYNLGITADYYAKVNFQGLKALVDALGGIDVPVPCRIEDYWPYPDENGEYPWMVLDPGMQHMDGRLALWYSRTRKTTSVFNREERQQQVLEAMWRGAKAAGFLEILPAAYEQYGNHVETNLGWGNILSLGRLAMQLEPSQVMLYNIGRDEVTPYTTPYGGGVYLPQWDKISPLIERALLPPDPSRAARNATKVEIWNASGREDWDILAADQLYQNGFTPVLAQYEGEPDAETSLHVFNTHAKGTGAPLLQDLFHIPDANVLYLGGNQSDIKLRLILGQDYDPCP